MPIDSPNRAGNVQTNLPPAHREAFDVLKLEPMADDEADAEWLRLPEAWHMH